VIDPKHKHISATKDKNSILLNSASHKVNLVAWYWKTRRSNCRIL